MDDAQLVQRAATCDLEAFAHVYDRHAAHLHDFLWWVLLDRVEAEDALYATFVEAGARIHELADPSRLRPWLFAVASRQALRHGPRRSHNGDDHGHHNGIGNGIGIGNGDGNGNGAVVAVGGEPSWDGLVEVVRGVGNDLSRRDRAVIDLRFRQGLGDEDLGAALGTDPSAAASLVERVAGHVEQTLGDTVVAYLGQKDCPELQDALGEFDGHLTERQRQLVEQHIAGCERCASRHARHVGAPALLRVAPTGSVPADLTARVLDDVQLAAHTGRPWPASRNGFPPPVGHVERRRWIVAVAAAVVLLLGAAGLIVTRDDGRNQQVAAVGTTVAPRQTTSTRVPPTTAPTTTAPAEGTEGVDPSSVGVAPAATPRPATPSGGGGAGTGTAGGAGGGGGGSGSGTGTNTGTGTNSSTNTSEAPATTAPTTTAAPDTTGPALSGMSVSPSTVRPGGGGCTNGDPTTTTVTVSATDPSGIASVVVIYAGVGGGTFPMGGAGGIYSATIGPFESPVPPGFTIPAGSLIVRATDTVGNTSTTQASLTLRCTA